MGCAEGLGWTDTCAPRGLIWLKGSVQELYRVARASMEGLSAEWDQDPCVRAKARMGQLLDLSQGDDPNNKSAVLNVGPLSPALTRLAGACLKLPEISVLRSELLDLYSSNQQQRTLDEVDDEAWALRSLLRFVKRKTQKRLVSKDAGLVLLACVVPFSFSFYLFTPFLLLHSRPSLHSLRPRIQSFKTCASS